MGAPTSSYATAGIVLRVSGVLKPHHHDKMENPSVGVLYHQTGERNLRCFSQKSRVPGIKIGPVTFHLAFCFVGSLSAVVEAAVRIL
jgi:hypothetical protein